MSLFGAAKKTSTFQKAKERMERMMQETSGPDCSVSVPDGESVSSGIGA